MVISIILVLVLVYLTFALGVAYWILTHATKQVYWLKVLGFIIGSIVTIIAAILLITTTYYAVKHRNDYYKQCPMYKIMQMHRQQNMSNNRMQSPCNIKNTGK